MHKYNPLLQPVLNPLESIDIFSPYVLCYVRKLVPVPPQSESIFILGTELGQPTWDISSLAWPSFQALAFSWGEKIQFPLYLINA